MSIKAMIGNLMFEIVCYLGGTAGDLVVGTVDSRGCTIQNGTVACDTERQRLKKSWQFCNDAGKLQYINRIKQQYRSIPSHDINFHINNAHDFIAVCVKRQSTAQWASNRFKELHTAQVWQEMSSVNQADTVEKYAQDILDWSSWIQTSTNRVIFLEDILDGCMIQKLSSIINIDEIDTDFYNKWLKTHHETSHDTCT